MKIEDIWLNLLEMKKPFEATIIKIDFWLEYNKNSLILKHACSMSQTQTCKIDADIQIFFK